MEERLINNGNYFDCFHACGNNHLYYLAGLEDDYDSWQLEAVNMLFDFDPGCIVVCSRGIYIKNSTLYLIDSSGRNSCLYLTWKQHYMGIASYYGAIVFWIPSGVKNISGRCNSNACGCDVYSDLWDWSIRHAHPDEFSFLKTDKKRVNLSIGIDKNFVSRATIEKNFMLTNKFSPITIQDTLEKTIKNGVVLCT